MHESMKKWLSAYGVEMTELVMVISALALIFTISLVIHVVLHWGVIRNAERMARKSATPWKSAFFERSLFNRLALALQGIIIYVQADLWLSPEVFVQPLLQTLAHLWVLFFALLSLFSLLDTLLDLTRDTALSRALPLRGISQGIKLVGSILIGILIIAALIGKSPVILFSGLGAMTAITMLVFKDPIMGLVAGIQLSANNMLSVGDWLEMPKYGADGDVIDIGLTTVKVRNWDNTITAIPTSALISDSFVNWRGMTDSGGRRIKRSFFIDASTVHFLDESELERLHKAKLLGPYLDKKINEINEYNRELQADLSSLVNGRRLTNLGTLRAYLQEYLTNHPQIHKGMTLMVRQLQPGSSGIPIELYCFTNTTRWVEYESIQSDIFDHILAVLPEFNLRVHQAPTGYDMRAMGREL
ncbi:mechanosensitive ion channel family protein [Desulfurispirillum indicum]|uniref:Mechanosensing system component YbdG n=1 Tax=Desulfurispirillum indicum (strain ATCC BAA-1389 / DSM 22839 / S5) TaxID=653733 RepID=E6W6M4_DESIS|nr:mechanosensitive ion channel domain-containing protein [Desulfurispirillum indicum]ADU65024.1 MscS Mechanosensitive ion channel [Desulfurispirillum indicum S5]